MGNDPRQRGSTAPSVAPVCATRAGRRHRGNPGRSAAAVSLAARAAYRRLCGRARTHCYGMVAASGATADARLFSCGRQGRKALLALSQRHLWPRDSGGALVHARNFRMRAYAEIAVTTNYSFLRGASRPQEFAVAATLRGLAAIGIADRNTLAGVVRLYDGLQE